MKIVRVCVRVLESSAEMHECLLGPFCYSLGAIDGSSTTQGQKDLAFKDSEVLTGTSSLLKEGFQLL